MSLRRISKSALLGGGRGKNLVYVSPTKGKVSPRRMADSIPVPRTTWWKENSLPPLFSIPQVSDIIKLESVEMARFFPDFELCEEGEDVFWLGEIDGIGKVKITYPQTYPAQKFSIELLDQDETLNEELRALVNSYEGITPAGSIVVAMRLFLLRRCSNAVVP